MAPKYKANLSLIANIGDQDYDDNDFKIKLSPIMFIDLWDTGYRISVTRFPID